MKYEKAMVSIINLGNEDILTCSGQFTGCNVTTQSNGFMGLLGFFSNMFKPYQPPKTNYTGGNHSGWGNGWGGGWGKHW